MQLPLIAAPGWKGKWYVSIVGALELIETKKGISGYGKTLCVHAATKSSGEGSAGHFFPAIDVWWVLRGARV